MNAQIEQEDVRDPETSTGGEDESSTERDGDDSHLHEDQKSPTYDELAPKSDATAPAGQSSDEKDKVQNLAKAGRDDFDPNKGQE